MESVISNRKEFLQSMGYFRQKYERCLMERESVRKQHAQSAQLVIMDQEIEEMRGSITENIKIGKHLPTEFLHLADEAEIQRSFELLGKENALKRKSQEKP